MVFLIVTSHDECRHFAHQPRCDFEHAANDNVTDSADAAANLRRTDCAVAAGPPLETGATV